MQASFRLHRFDVFNDIEISLLLSSPKVPQRVGIEKEDDRRQGKTGERERTILFFSFCPPSIAETLISSAPAAAVSDLFHGFFVDHGLRGLPHDYEAGLLNACQEARRRLRKHRVVDEETAI